MLGDGNEHVEIGRRARLIRRRRGLSLDAAAGLAGISKPYLSMLETGRRRFDRRALLEDLASALGCSVTDLTGQPYLPVNREAADAMAVVPEIRLALNDFGPDDVPDVRPRQLAELVSWADEANELCAQASYARAGQEIGRLLTESQVHAWSAGQADRHRAFATLVTACFVAGVVASRTGNVDLSVLAARRGADLAERHGDPGLLGFARWYWAIELTSVAARSRSRTVLTTTIDRLTPAANLRSHDTLTAEMLGHLHLQQARTAARELRADDAHTHLAEAQRLAAGVGERNGMRQHFGPTNVAVWRLTTGIELSEGGRAYDETMRAGLDVSALASNERLSSLNLDLARALVQDGRDRDEKAVGHLDTADRVAPQRVRPDPLARELVRTLNARARRRSWELDSLRNRFGIG